jgi:hypothetical protein
MTQALVIVGQAIAGRHPSEMTSRGHPAVVRSNIQG